MHPRVSPTLHSVKGRPEASAFLPEDVTFTWRRTHSVTCAQRGCTLIELVVAMVIAAILVAELPQFGRHG
jgi:prepilin-type N-terminal cleavage/methylation domain-containing protein